MFFAFLENDSAGGAVLSVRTTSLPETAFGSVRTLVRQLDANVPV